MLDEDSRANVAKTLAHIEAITGTLAGESSRLSAIVGDAEVAMKHARQASTASPDLMRDVTHSTQTLAKMAEQLRAAGDDQRHVEDTAANSGQ